ncbi:MAG: ATP synthase A1 subunit C [Methanobacteriota archaeon]|nr:MAG: ATP synthase A1 subunit C [Euryarchaeota archaeon]
MKLVGGKGNYAYACARVKARKQFLLTREVYSRLLVMDVHEIGRFLGETQYSEEMTLYASGHSGADLVEVAITRNLAATYSDILNFTTGNLRDMVANYLRRWDTFNVKTILRGKFSGADEEEIIDTLVPAGAFSEAFLKTLVDKESVGAIMEELSKYSSLRITSELEREVVESGKLAPFEDHLDMILYSDLLEVLEPTTNATLLLKNFVRREIDVANLKVLLKLKVEEFPEDKVQKYLIPGGMEFSMSKLRTLAQAKGTSMILEEMERSSMYDEIKPSLDRFKEDNKLSGLTIALDKALVRTAEKFGRYYPLSVLPILDYIIRKKAEIDNIRIIARGKEKGLSNEVIEGLLVI